MDFEFDFEDALDTVVNVGLTVVTAVAVGAAVKTGIEWLTEESPDEAFERQKEEIKIRLRAEAAAKKEVAAAEAKARAAQTQAAEAQARAELESETRTILQLQQQVAALTAAVEGAPSKAARPTRVTPPVMVATKAAQVSP